MTIPTAAPADNDNHDFNNSRPLDTHRWSDNPAVDAFVDHIFDVYLKTGNPRKRKRILKIILLDFYVARMQDPSLKLSVSLNVNDYRAGSRYNPMQLSEVFVAVIKQLVSVGLLEIKYGFLDRRTGIGRLSRVWAAPALAKMLGDAKFPMDAIELHHQREFIVLRDDRKREVDYVDTTDTIRMRNELTRYNALLAETSVTLERVDGGHLTVEKTVIPTRDDDCVRRIFNRSSFDMGGRLYGGWWQRLPKESRALIRLNGKETKEIDFSAMHIRMLYAEVGRDYDRKVDGDAYEIPKPDFLKDPAQTREVAKAVALIAINAKDDTATFQAFNEERADELVKRKLTKKEIVVIIDSLRMKHPLIAHRFASDAGIELMRGDSDIAALVIADFVNRGVPILSVHDSFIVPTEEEVRLRVVMEEAFRSVLFKGNSSLSLAA